MEYLNWKKIASVHACNAVRNGAKCWPLPEGEFYHCGFLYTHGLETKRGTKYVVSSHVMRAVEAVIHEMQAQIGTETLPVSGEISSSQVEIMSPSAETTQRITSEIKAGMSSGNLTLGQVVKKLRTELIMMSQPQFADFCGVSENTILRVEKYGANPRIETLAAILSPFGMYITIGSSSDS